MFSSNYLVPMHWQTLSVFLVFKLTSLSKRVLSLCQCKSEAVLPDLVPTQNAVTKHAGAAK